jgi:hypothetical protein
MDFNFITRPFLTACKIETQAQSAGSATALIDPISDRWCEKGSGRRAIHLLYDFYHEGGGVVATALFHRFFHQALNGYQSIRLSSFGLTGGLGY